MSLKISQQVPGSVKATDRLGNDAGAALDSAPVWSADPSMVKLDVAPDGMSVMIIPVGPVGKVSVGVASASGGKPLSGSVDIDLTAGDAVQLSVSLGDPVDQ